MTREELLEKAVYIQYSRNYSDYNSSVPTERKVHRLPLPKSGEMYDGWALNTNHFTTAYHRQYALPLINSLFNFGFNENDFELVERKSGIFDISTLCPKKEFKFEIFGYNSNEHFDDISYDELKNNDNTPANITDYHKLYRYPHQCSRIINKTIVSDKKLFISGDSQMIPDVPVLACYFKEIFYFDNRANLSLSHHWKDIDFTNVLIQLNDRGLDSYTVTNFR